MRVCDIAQFYSPLSGGVKRYLLDKRRHLARVPGAHHVLVVPSHRDAVTHDASATTYEICSPRLAGSRSYRLLIARARILQIVAAEAPDLIEVGDPYHTAWIGLGAGRRLGVPVVATYHSDYPRALGRSARRLASELSRRLVSPPVDRYLTRLYNHMAATVVGTQRLHDVLAHMGIQRLVRIPLGTDVNTFCPQPSRRRVRAELGIDEGQPMLLFVGRMGREKNLRHLISSLDLLPPTSPPPCLVLVGDGELRGYVRGAAARRANLIWLPYCESARRLAELYSAADLFVHAGTHETFGLVALEAQACGTPVLVVRHGGVDEAVAGEEPPCVAADGSAPGLAAAMHAFLQAGDTPERRAARRQRVVECFSNGYTFARLFALYAHLIERRPLAEFLGEELHSA